jgi:tetratricopeptide (TPR) repeat protein
MICPRCGDTADSQATTCRVCLAPLAVLTADATIAAVAEVGAYDATGGGARYGTSANVFATVPGIPPVWPRPDGADTTISGVRLPVRREGGLLQEGTDFGPRYHIIRTLGAGGMGSVYHAWDKELHVAVALKIIRRSQNVDTVGARDLEERFKRELLLARKVTHKSVVRIYDLGVVDGIKYITMSYVEGHDLFATLKQGGGPLPVARVLTIAREVIEGLRAAHDAGVVHRDLKPANIMVEAATGQALIMDFGIALSPADGKPRSEGIVGTLPYMSPQQATGQPVDQSTDLYSFGLILYDLLGGRPIDRDSERAMADMLARIGSVPHPIRERNPAVPQAVEALIAKCLEPSVERRYQTAAEVAADLAKLDENGVPIPLPKSRRPAFLAAAAVVTLVLTGTSWWVGRASRAPAVQHAPASVLIADFNNRTGDPVFSGSLEQALTDSVERASFITAYRRDAAKRLAQRVRPGGLFDADAARLVSRREGVNYVLAGSIASNGSGYTIGVTALEPATGKAVSTVSTTARTKTDVLAAVSSAAEKIRASLGETSQERLQHGADAKETFTASSLEAMNAYAHAQELANGTHNREALAAYKQAVTLDPGFGRAYAGMGVIYTVFKDEAKAKASYELALKYVGRMSDREKYRTLGTYYLSIVRNYEKAIENYEMLVNLYPGDAVGHGNLGLAYLNAGNLKRAAEEGREVIRLDPNNSVQRYNYAMYSLYAGDLAVAAREGETIVKESPSFELAYLPIGLAKTLGGDLAGAEGTYDRLAATGPSGASLAQFARVDLAMFRGRYADASTMIGATLAGDRKANDAGATARDLVVAAEAFTVLGRKANAIVAATQAVGLSQHESVLFPAALILIEAGREEDARKIADRLENMLQQHTTAYARVISAEIAVRRGSYGPAIELFRDSIKRRDTWMARFLLGRTYAEADHFAEAMAELEICVNRRGEAADPFFYDIPSLRYLPPVYYWLARAQLAMGVADAAKNYEYYLALRRDAAPLDPLLADAERRLATLK